MKTIRSLVAMSLVLGLAEALLFADGVHRGWALAHADRNTRL